MRDDGGAVSSLTPAIHQGLPIWVPSNAGAGVAVYAPGEGGDNEVRVSPVLAGLAITAHAAEYLYFGAERRFPVAAVIKAYKYLVLAEAGRLAAAELKPADAQRYMVVLGVEW